MGAGGFSLGLRTVHGEVLIALWRMRVDCHAHRTSKREQYSQRVGPKIAAVKTRSPDSIQRKNKIAAP